MKQNISCPMCRNSLSEWKNIILTAWRKGKFSIQIYAFKLRSVERKIMKNIDKENDLSFHKEFLI
jgi:hypothetical protein